MYTKLFQQGDVLHYLTDGKLPEGATPVPAKGGRLVLAEGSSTGHSHVINDVAGASLHTTAGGTMMLVVTAPNGVEVTHDEHKPITLPTGVYAIERVQTVDPFTKEVSAVAD